MKQIQEFGVYVSIDEKDCINDRILGPTWVDRRKGEECKSRLCVLDLAHTRSDDHFAPTPTDETTRILEELAVHKNYKMRTANVSAAVLRAEEKIKVIVRPPAEWRELNKAKLWLPIEGFLRQVHGAEALEQNVDVGSG